MDDLDKAIDQFKEYAYYQDYLNEKEELNDDNDDQEGYGDYLVNENIIEAFRLAKIEERLDEASSILEKEVLKDYDVRKYTNDSRKSCNNYAQIKQKNSKYIGQVNPF